MGVRSEIFWEIWVEIWENILKWALFTVITPDLQTRKHRGITIWALNRWLFDDLGRYLVNFVMPGLPRLMHSVVLGPKSGNNSRKTVKNEQSAAYFRFGPDQFQMKLALPLIKTNGSSSRGQPNSRKYQDLLERIWPKTPGTWEIFKESHVPIESGRVNSARHRGVVHKSRDVGHAQI